jgi:hypothetical protein
MNHSVPRHPFCYHRGEPLLETSWLRELDKGIESMTMVSALPEAQGQTVRRNFHEAIEMNRLPRAGQYFALRALHKIPRYHYHAVPSFQVHYFQWTNLARKTSVAFATRFPRVFHSSRVSQSLIADVEN